MRAPPPGRSWSPDERNTPLIAPERNKSANRADNRDTGDEHGVFPERLTGFPLSLPPHRRAAFLVTDGSLNERCPPRAEPCMHRGDDGRSTNDLLQAPALRQTSSSRNTVALRATRSATCQRHIRLVREGICLVGGPARRGLTAGSSTRLSAARSRRDACVQAAESCWGFRVPQASRRRPYGAPAPYKPSPPLCKALSKPGTASRFLPPPRRRQTCLVSRFRTSRFCRIQVAP